MQEHLRLSVVSGSACGRVITVSEAGGILGRDANCNEVLDEPTVSRRHCEIRFEKGRWIIRDMDSLTGVVVNGKRVVESVLRSHDTISLGSLTLRLGDVPAATTTVPCTDSGRGTGALIAGTIGSLLCPVFGLGLPLAVPTLWITHGRIRRGAAMRYDHITRVLTSIGTLLAIAALGVEVAAWQSPPRTNVPQERMLQRLRDDERRASMEKQYEAWKESQNADLERQMAKLSSSQRRYWERSRRVWSSVYAAWAEGFRNSANTPVLRKIAVLNPDRDGKARSVSSDVYNGVTVELSATGDEVIPAYGVVWQSRVPVDDRTVSAVARQTRTTTRAAVTAIHEAQFQLEVYYVAKALTQMPEAFVSVTMLSVGDLRDQYGNVTVDPWYEITFLGSELRKVNWSGLDAGDLHRLAAGYERHVVW